eukprot:EG_transcript_25188
MFALRCSRSLVAISRPPVACRRTFFWRKETPGAVTVQSLQEARELETLGGTHDGRYQGQPILIDGVGRFARAPGAGGAAEAGAERIVVGSVAEAEALDQKDGAVDGRYFGVAIEIEGVGLYPRLRASLSKGLTKMERLSDGLDRAAGELPEFTALDRQELPPQVLLMQIRMQKDEKKAAPTDKPATPPTD